MRTASDITREIIGAAIKVHRTLGPGLLEKIYEKCLIVELRKRGLCCDTQVPGRLNYEGEYIGIAHRADLIVEDEVIVEVKAVVKLEQRHKAQLLSYQMLFEKTDGLLLNFGGVMMMDGVWRSSKPKILDR